MVNKRQQSDLKITAIQWIYRLTYAYSLNGLERSQKLIKEKH